MLKHPKIFLSKLISVICITSSFVTILLAFWTKSFTKLIENQEYTFFVTLLVFNVLVTFLLQTKKKSVTVKISNTLTANVLSGDIFNHKGVSVIPVNEYFDTIVDGQIITPNTIHGQFINKYFKGSEDVLKNKISDSLENIMPKGINRNRIKGNKTFYPLGTVARVEHSGNIYFLVALTRFNQNNRAEITKSEYQQVLIGLFDYVEQFSQGYKICMPLIGSGHAGVGLSDQKILEFILFSLALNDKLTLVDDIDILLHKSNEDSIDLNTINYYFKFIGD